MSLGSCGCRAKQGPATDHLGKTTLSDAFLRVVGSEMVHPAGLEPATF